MPIYEFLCKAKTCGNETNYLMSFKEYEEFESMHCPGCERILTKEHRVLGTGLKTNVIGDRKGGPGSVNWRGG